MNRKNLLTGICVLVVAAGAGAVSAATRTHRGTRAGDPQDKEFLRTLAVDDMTEANLAEMAQNKAAKQPVRDFAQTVVKDQTNEYGQLSMLASKTGDSIPKGINTGRNASARMLMHASGSSFDRAFVHDEIAGQARAVAALKREAEHGANPDIKAWAGQELATRQQELEQARALAK
jgi:predicted outer membrane protein